MVIVAAPVMGHVSGSWLWTAGLAPHMTRRPSGLWISRPTRLMVPSAVSWLGVRWTPRRAVEIEAEARLGDLRVLLSARASGDAKHTALEQTVDQIHWTPRRSTVRRAL